MTETEIIDLARPWLGGITDDLRLNLIEFARALESRASNADSMTPEQFIADWQQSMGKQTPLTKESVLCYVNDRTRRASNAGGVHPDHLELLKPFMSERDGRLTHSLTVHLREMAEPEFAERMHKARARLYTASNAGGAVAAGYVHAGDLAGINDCIGLFKNPSGDVNVPLYTHPAPASKEPVMGQTVRVGMLGTAAPASKEPVADERAALSKAEIEDLAFAYCPSGKIGELMEFADALFARAAAPAKPEGVWTTLPYPRHGEPGALEQGEPA